MKFPRRRYTVLMARVTYRTKDDEVYDRMRNGDTATRNRISDTGAR